MTIAPSSADAPVLKVGAVVLRAVASCSSPVASESDACAVVPPPVGGRLGGGRYDAASPPRMPPHPTLSPAGGEGVLAATNHEPRTTNYHILILRPIPKNAGEVTAFVLPRGSRQYRDDAGAWHDARDAATGAKHAAMLEPFERALAREIEEEAGVSSTQLAAAQVQDLGRLDFESRSKGVYPIHWFVVTLTAADASLLDEKIMRKHWPTDALEMRFASLDEIKTMAVRGEFSAGYIPVIEAALAQVNLPSPLRESRFVGRVTGGGVDKANEL